MNNILFSKKSDHWATPKMLYEAFINKGFIDPCPLHEDYNKPLTHFYCKKLFINPPYSQISKWVDYAIEEAKNNNYIFLLIPARTDTLYFHKLLEYNPTIYFIKGRLHFNEIGTAPFPSIMIIFKHDNIYCNKHYLNGSIEELINDINKL